MGLLVDGVWTDQWYDTKSTAGHFERKASQFRNWLTAGGAAGSNGRAGFIAESDRYHLYVSLACPWAHRTLIFRKLKSLEELVPVTVVHPHMLEQGWQFDPAEALYGLSHAHQLYCKADPQYTGRVTVPILWDREQQTIVSNESAEIIRMFNSAFNDLTGNRDDYYPVELSESIDEINAFIYENINNGVYRCGFATTQEAYEEAFDKLFAALDRLELRLSSQRYLVGKQITEADWRLFTTLIRFDAVYVGHFKCSRNRIVDMPNLWGYLRDLYQHIEHIKAHYYYSHESINPTRIVPKGPELNFSATHDRARFAS